ncbi:TetR/AcrR family transcriptional regulator [Goodfellowiella coeruleoviolacea]|uniref:Transcriptional regulator, TetR family n=1 Tax=Goodfellowiella coeruleoviolacea TaxID=334858 RepID=A0AAE3GIY1_9PSEU|nr:TetR/AcrR family transcriptional regulator [Goodfellowiella coeruleoviolacea]MCP2168468.1 transcriptional regulator, TetR family [Goodfellowiella coeruleoviolacea]
MPNRGDRGGARTRARIAEVATELFLERGFDDVTIAEVAAAAGVSKVTVFAHFERKEDLLLDRLPDVIDIVRTAIRDRADGLDPVEALRQAALALAAQRHPLSGLSEGADVEPFVRTLMASPALIARLRAFAHEIETELAAALHADAGFSGDSTLTAALLVAAYRTVAAESLRRRLAGDDLADIATAHQQRVNAAFDAVAHGVSASHRPAPRQPKPRRRR